MSSLKSVIIASIKEVMGLEAATRQARLGRLQVLLQGKQFRFGQESWQARLLGQGAPVNSICEGILLGTYFMKLIQS